MSKRTTIVLAAVAAALLAFILIWERHTLSTGDTADRAGRLLERFVRAKVVALEIEREGEHIRLERERETEAELGEWVMTKPVETDADQDVISSTLSALDWATPRRTLEGIGEQDRKKFGLDEPRLEASFTVADTTVPIRFGAEDATEGGVYVQLDEPTEAYVVGKDVFEALDHGAGHFRSKDLLRGVDVDDARELELSSGAGTARLERREGRWRLLEPLRGLASSSAVGEVLDALDELAAQRFVEDAPKDLGPYGLDAPTLEAALRESEQGAERVALRAGGACAEHEGERYARLGDGPVVCVRDSDLEALRREPRTLRQTRLVTAQIGDLAAMELEAAGAELAVRRTEDGWRWEAGGRDGEADPDAVRDWLASLRETEAAEFVEATDASLAERGLSSPQATLTLRFEQEDRPAEVVHLGATGAEGAWLRRGEEPVLLRAPQTVAPLFDASPVRLRSRILLAEPDDAATRLSIGGAALTETLERREDRWWVLAPVEARADTARAGELTRRLASLTAKRFEADAAAPEHGLRAPRAEVEMTFEGASTEAPPDGGVAAPEPDAEAQGPRRHVLRIGAETEGGAYATLDDDPAVFVVEQALVDAVTTPHVDRSLLATASENVQALRIERPGAEPFAVIRSEGGWRTEGGEPADDEAVREILDRLGAMRATEVTGYGPAPAAHGLALPRARITVTRSDEAPAPREHTIAIGAETDEGVHARRTDVEAGLLLPADAAAVFLDAASTQPE